MNQQLTPSFTLDEFRCKCCGQVNTQAATRLATQLQKVRIEYGIMKLISGFRCPRQNEKVGGKMFSQHLIGLAADIDCTSDAARFELVSLLLKHGFKRIGIAGLFIHADIGTITGPLIWVY